MSAFGGGAFRRDSGNGGGNKKNPFGNKSVPNPKNTFNANASAYRDETDTSFGGRGFKDTASASGVGFGVNGSNKGGGIFGASKATAGAFGTGPCNTGGGFEVKTGTNQVRSGFGGSAFAKVVGGGSTTNSGGESAFGQTGTSAFGSNTSNSTATSFGKGGGGISGFRNNKEGFGISPIKSGTTFAGGFANAKSGYTTKERGSVRGVGRSQTRAVGNSGSNARGTAECGENNSKTGGNMTATTNETPSFGEEGVKAVRSDSEEVVDRGDSTSMRPSATVDMDGGVGRRSGRGRVGALSGRGVFGRQVALDRRDDSQKKSTVFGRAGHSAALPARSSVLGLSTSKGPGAKRRPSVGKANETTAQGRSTSAKGKMGTAVERKLRIPQPGGSSNAVDTSVDDGAHKEGTESVLQSTTTSTMERLAELQSRVNPTGGTNDVRAMRFNTGDTSVVQRKEELEKRDDRERAQQGRRLETIIPACEDMCPELERYAREVNLELDNFEKIPGAFSSNGRAVCDHYRAIKKFRRSAPTDKESLPNEIRTPNALLKTLDYITSVILDDTKVPLSSSFGFVNDRFRALRTDMAQQELKDTSAITLYEQNVRFHLHSSCILSGSEGFEFKHNHDEMRKALISLKEVYDLHRGNTDNLSSENEPEMTAVLIISGIMDWKTGREMSATTTQDLSPCVRYSEDVGFAIEVLCAVRALDYYRFFSLCRKAKYIILCALHPIIDHVRAQALEVMSTVYRLYPLDHLMFSFMFNSIEQTANFIQVHGLKCDAGKGMVSFVREQPFAKPDSRYPLQPMRFILDKLNEYDNNHTHASYVVTNGKVPNVPDTTPLMSSFQEFPAQTTTKIIRPTQTHAEATPQVPIQAPFIGSISSSLANRMGDRSPGITETITLPDQLHSQHTVELPVPVRHDRGKYVSTLNAKVIEAVTLKIINELFEHAMYLRAKETLELRIRQEAIVMKNVGVVAVSTRNGILQSVVQDIIHQVAIQELQNAKLAKEESRKKQAILLHQKIIGEVANQELENIISFVVSEQSQKITRIQHLCARAALDATNTLLSDTVSKLAREVVEQQLDDSVREYKRTKVIRNVINKWRGRVEKRQQFMSAVNRVGQKTLMCHIGEMKEQHYEPQAVVHTKRSTNEKMYTFSHAPTTSAVEPVTKWREIETDDHDVLQNGHRDDTDNMESFVECMNEKDIHINNSVTTWAKEVMVMIGLIETQLDISFRTTLHRLLSPLQELGLCIIPRELAADIVHKSIALYNAAVQNINTQKFSTANCTYDSGKREHKVGGVTLTNAQLTRRRREKRALMGNGTMKASKRQCRAGTAHIGINTHERVYDTHRAVISALTIPGCENMCSGTDSSVNDSAIKQVVRSVAGWASSISHQDVTEHQTLTSEIQRYLLYVDTNLYTKGRSNMRADVGIGVGRVGDYTGYTDEEDSGNEDVWYTRKYANVNVKQVWNLGAILENVFDVVLYNRLALVKRRLVCADPGLVVENNNNHGANAVGAVADALSCSVRQVVEFAYEEYCRGKQAAASTVLHSSSMQPNTLCTNSSTNSKSYKHNKIRLTNTNTHDTNVRNTTLHNSNNRLSSPMELILSPNSGFNGTGGGDGDVGAAVNVPCLLSKTAEHIDKEREEDRKWEEFLTYQATVT
eukprot:CFRG6536T1